MNLKLSNYISEEGKQKIIKKIKESLDKNHICYLDHIIEEIFFRNDINKKYPNKNKSNLEKDLNKNLVLTRPNEFCFISEKFDMQECLKQRTDHKISQLQKNEELFLTENLKEDLTQTQFLTNYEKKSKNQIIKSNSFDFVNKQLENSLPVMSRKYKVKNYDSRDFHCK